MCQRISYLLLFLSSFANNYSEFNDWDQRNFLKDVRHNFSYWKRCLCEGTLSEVPSRRLPIRRKGAEEAVHSGEEPIKTDHDWETNFGEDRPPFPSKIKDELSGWKETLLCSWILPRRIAFHRAIRKVKAHRRPVTIILVRTKFYAGQIVLALEALHQHDIIYREYRQDYLVWRLKTSYWTI